MHGERSSSRLRSTTRPAVVGVEIATGVALLGAATLVGLVLTHRPWPNRLDVAGFALLPAEPRSRLYNDIAVAGSLKGLLVGVALAVLLCAWRDKARAVACLVGPIVAVVVTEWVAKPLVARHVTVGGGNSYPSGTVTAATAVVVALVVASPRLLRPMIACAGTILVAAVCAAVVAMRWHFPTDALGGICVGSGSVWFVDGLVHLPSAFAARSRGRGSSVGPEVDRARVPVARPAEALSGAAAGR